MENKQTKLKYLYDKAIGDLVKCSLRIKELEAERDADRKREYGYSQQTVDALTLERDKLRAERNDWKARYQSVAEMRDALIKEYNEVRAENKRLAGELAKWTRKHDDADLQGMKKQADQPSLAAKQAYINALVYYLRHAEDENKRLEAWIDDLQSGMWINCVYCGHRYGPNSGPATKDFNITMRKALEAHIAECPKHPLSAAKQEIRKLKLRNAYLEELLDGDQVF